MPSSPTLSTTSCQTFPFFSQLPPELRLKIWEYNLPGPRIVPVRCGAHFPSPSSSSPPSPSSSSPFRDYHHHHHRNPSASPPAPLPWCTSPAALPTNLHVCREARTEALRRYSRLFGLAGLPGHVYVDPACDVLYFGPRSGYMAAEAQMRTLLALADPAELLRVRRVAVHERLWGGGSSGGRQDSSSTAPARGGPTTRRVARRVARRRQPNAADTATPPSDTDTSRLAVHLAADVLDQLRIRLPGLHELLIVPGDEATDDDDGDDDEQEEQHGHDSEGEAEEGLSATRPPVSTSTAVVARVPLLMALMAPSAQPWQQERTACACLRWRSAVPCASSYHACHGYDNSHRYPPHHIARVARVVQAALHRLTAGAPPDWLPPPWDVSLAVLGGAEVARPNRAQLASLPKQPQAPTQQPQQLQQPQKRTFHQRQGSRKTKAKVKTKACVACGSALTPPSATITASAAASAFASRHRNGCGQLALRTTAGGSVRVRYRKL